MRVEMIQTYGVFEAGKVYDVSDAMGNTLLLHDKAKLAKKKEAEPAQKNMKPGQVKKGGL